ncbi:MAG: hypothetical protein KAS58_07015, partial [Calditrichia bacterium]|nr:hypothetical protein [Calditrichia bacterium]
LDIPCWLLNILKMHGNLMQRPCPWLLYYTPLGLYMKFIPKIFTTDLHYNILLNNKNKYLPQGAKMGN